MSRSRPATALDPRRIERRYAGDAERPLGSFLALMTTYGGAVAAAGVVIRARKVDLPERVGLQDLGMIAVATHRLARLIALDPVTSPIRAPFTRFKGQAGEAELDEEVIGSGLQKAIGELVTCPFCLGQWVATAFMIGYVVRPRPTRLAAAAFTAMSAADLLQSARSAVEQKVVGD